MDWNGLLEWTTGLLKRNTGLLEWTTFTFNMKSRLGQPRLLLEREKMSCHIGVLIQAAYIIRTQHTDTTNIRQEQSFLYNYMYVLDLQASWVLSQV